MHMRRVDSRDATWDIDRPAYRAYFWQQQDGRPDGGWVREEWQIEGADVREVLAWAGEDETGRAYTLYVCCPCEGVLGLIRLHGRDPTAEG